MKCSSCGDILRITHTENTATGAVKRRRRCYCGEVVSTFERNAKDTLNEREQRLINKFRKLSVDQTGLLWAFLGLMNINGE